jgi:ribosomal protein S18 acetylase RimI-like enzyme
MNLKMDNEETLEYGLLQHIKLCLECNNESQAIRLLEKYGFEKQEERYSEEEVMDMFHNLSMHLPLHYEFLVKEQFKNK